APPTAQARRSPTVVQRGSTRRHGWLVRRAHDAGCDTAPARRSAFGRARSGRTGLQLVDLLRNGAVGIIRTAVEERGMRTLQDPQGIGGASRVPEGSTRSWHSGT